MSLDKAKEVEAELILANKKQIDKRTKCGNTVIMDKKCKRCGKIHPIFHYQWHLSRSDHYPSLLISIPCMTDNDFLNVRKAERALSAIGIHFDTGYGGLRDWEFDWSLSGEQSIGVCSCKRIDRDKTIDKGINIPKYILRKILWKILVMLS